MLAEKEQALVKTAPYFSWYTERAPLDALVSLKRYVSHDVFVTAGGTVGVGIDVLGASFSTLSPEDLDTISRKFARAVRLLGPGFRIYQYLVKRDGARIERFEYSNPTVMRWQEERLNHIEASGLSTIRLYMVIIYEPSDEHKILSWSKRMFLDKTVDELTANLGDAIYSVRRGAAESCALLEDSLGTRIMDEAEWYRTWREYLNPDPEIAAARRYSPGDDLDYSAADTPISIKPKDHLAWGDPEGDYYKLKAFVLKTLPTCTLPENRNQIPFLLRELQERVETNLIVCTEWAAEETRSALRSTKRKRRIRSGQTVGTLQKLNDVEAEDDVADLGRAQRDIRSSRHGKFSMTLLLFDRDEVRLRAAESRLKSIHWDGVFSEVHNRKMRLTTFLATMPGNAAWNLQRQWISTTNYVDLSFLFNLSTGRKRNEYWKREYLSVFETEDGTPFYLNLHHGELAHAVMFGSPRAGKSVLANQIIGDFQKNGGYTFILDIGGSYRAITYEFGGLYVSLDLNRWRIKINPFALDLSDKGNISFLHEFVRQLILNEKWNIESTDDADLLARIRSMRHVSRESRRLGWLAEILPPGLKGSLHRWTGTGPYARVFDNVEDEFEAGRFLTFDFTQMQDHPQALGPLMFYFFHRINQIVRDPKLLRLPKMLVIDEGYAFLEDWLQEALMTYPKNNAFIMFITQSEASLRVGNFMEIISSTCPNKFLLPNPGADVSVYGEKLNLNSRERELFVTIQKPWFLWKTPYESHVLRNRMEPKWKERYETQRYEGNILAMEAAR